MAIDLRGHGDTRTKNEGDLSTATQASDVIAVVRAVFGNDAPPIVLIGYSTTSPASDLSVYNYTIL